MKPTVFISRSAERSSTFIESLRSRTSSITTQSLLDFKLIRANELPTHGWLFFYSQTGVDFFFKQFGIEDIQHQQLKIGVFGPKTGQHLGQYGILPDFIGSAIAETTAASFLSNLSSNDRVTFVRGKKSVNSLKSLLPDDVIQDDLLVYDNQIQVSCALPYHDILVFTSPMNLQAYYNSNPLLSQQSIIVIGPTTAMAGLTLGMEQLSIARHPSMEGLANQVQEHIDRLNLTA